MTKHPLSKYRPMYAKMAKGMCMLGATDEDLAFHFEVSPLTIINWRNTHEKFAEACQIGKKHADERVKRGIYTRAVGYNREAVKIFLAKDGTTVYAPYIEHYPPDTAAGKFWLLNRDPANWSDRQDHKVEGSVVINISKEDANLL